MTNRLEVVQAALGWLGTPYHHQARVKGVGVDCIGLVIGVARELALVPPEFDVGAYPRVPGAGQLMAHAREHMVEIERAAMQAGDVVALAFERDPQHFGILVDYRHGGLAMLHAAALASPPRVIETRLLFSPTLKFVAAFALPGVL